MDMHVIYEANFKTKIMQCENVEADGLRKKCTFDIE
jgi:hypothetical protein